MSVAEEQTVQSELAMIQAVDIDKALQKLIWYSFLKIFSI